MMRAELNYSSVWSKDTDKWRTLAAGAHDGQIILFGDNFDTGKHYLEQDDDDGLPCANVQECKDATAAGVIGSEIAAEKRCPCFKNMACSCFKKVAFLADCLQCARHCILDSYLPPSTQCTV